LIGHLSYLAQQRLHRRPQRLAHFAHHALVHLIRVATAQPVAERLAQPPRRVDQRRPRIHQRCPRPDHCQVGLCRLAAVLDRIQQRYIHSRQPRQRPRIQPIVFALAFRDQPHLARIRHDHRVPQLAQMPAHPGRMRPHLDHHPASHQRAEALVQPVPGGGKPTLGNHLAALVQHAVATRSIAQIHADRQLAAQLRLALTYLPGVTLFHAGLLSAPSSASLGSLPHPAETGLLIPSR
jgi:hypothetical protein